MRRDYGGRKKRNSLFPTVTTTEIASTALFLLRAWWIAAVVALLFVVPLALKLFQNVSRGGFRPTDGDAIGAVFIACAIVLLAAAMRRTIQYIQVGEVWLSRVPEIPTSEDILAIRLRFSRTPAKVEHVVRLIQKRQSITPTGQGTRYATGIKHDDAKVVFPVGNTLDVCFEVPDMAGNLKDYLTGQQLWWEVHLELPNGQTRRFLLERHLS